MPFPISPMTTHDSLTMLTKVQELADAGQFAAVVEYLDGWNAEQLRDSPTLALMYGIARTRLGAYDEGRKWVGHALERARERADHTVEAQALNVSGAIAFETGDIDEAARYFQRALSEAQADGDHITVGRCSNNLGIIAHLRGDVGRAVGSFTLALAAFERAGLQRGIAEVLHNLAIAHGDRGDLEKALETAHEAVAAAQEAGDPALVAQTQGGRAEIRLHSGDLPLAEREIGRALDAHRAAGNILGEADDMRVFANIAARRGDIDEAEGMFRDLIERAEELQRPLLAARVERDLAQLLMRTDRAAEGKEIARTARVRFKALGAVAEVRALDRLLNDEKLHTEFEPNSQI